jgi:gentisate 1,2-dioxygenase
LTTSKCPPSVAMWSGVESVSLFLGTNVKGFFLFCFIQEPILRLLNLQRQRQLEVC